MSFRPVPYETRGKIKTPREYLGVYAGRAAGNRTQST